MFSATPGAWIQKWILIGEIVKSAFGNDFQNRQCLVAKNPDRQLAARNELLYQNLIAVP